MRSVRPPFEPYLTHQPRQVILAAEENVQTAVEAAIRFVPPTRARYCVQQLLPLMTPEAAEAFVQSMRDKSHVATATASSSALTASAVLEPRAEQWAQLAVKGQFKIGRAHV